MPSKKNRRVSEKIAVLRREGTPQDQAVAMAYAMEKAGRLGAHGEYKRKKKRCTHCQ